MTRKATWIDSFDLPPGRVLAGKYVVERKLGGGWESEVYKVVESRTGVRRAAKLFKPQHNERDRAVKFYAQKLERLRDCSIVPQDSNGEDQSLAVDPELIESCDNHREKHGDAHDLSGYGAGDVGGFAEEAVVELESLRGIASTTVPVWEALAEAHEHLGNKEEAARCAARAKYLRDRLWMQP